MAVFSEIIKLEDQVSPAAKEAAGEAKALSGALASVNASLLKASALGDIQGFKTLTKQSEALKTALGQVDEGLLKEVADAKSADDANARLAKSQAEAQKSQDGLNSVMQEGTAAMEGYALAAGAAIAGLVVGFGALVVAGAKFAIETSGAKTAALGLWTALGRGIITGAQVDDMLDGLRKRTGIAKDTLAPLTEGFLRMGITSKASLEELTVAAISAEATIKGGGAAFTALFQKIDSASQSGSKLTIPFKKLQATLVDVGTTQEAVAKQMGMSEKDLVAGLGKGTISAKKFGEALTDAITKNGKGPLDILANSFDNISKDLKGTWGDIWEDFGNDIAPFMKEVKGLFGIIDSKSNPSGEALKSGIGGFFKQVFAAATKVVPLVKHLLLDMIIYGLRAYISLKPIIGWLKQIGSSQATMDTLVTGFKILGYAVVGVVGALGAVIGFIGLVAYGFVSGAVGIYNMAAALLGFMGTIGSFIAGAAVALAGWVAGAATAAYDFVAGLVSGIANGAGQVIGAVTGLASSATGAFKSALGISSPSKVMMSLGGHVASGTAEGIEAGSGDVHGAASGMATAAVAGATSGGGTSSGGGGSKGDTTINVTVQIDGAGKSAMDITQEMVALVFERAALSAGV